MKILKLALVALGFNVVVLTFSGTASAAVVSVQIGTPPPPPPAFVDRPWARPYRTAVWIEPHYEWIRGRWVWIRGYYAYPPYAGAVWIPGRYRHGYWRPGHWA
jgi:hypothetical protein